MQYRLGFIEQAIVKHLATLRYETGDSYDESIGISNLTTKQKLKILMLNQEFIDKSS